MAAQGSRPAPIFPDSPERVMAAGAPSVPLRPRNSRRSPVTVRSISLVAKNATRPANSVL